jgi:hypothetical protein
MGRHYSTKDFFRQMPNALLARYFQGRGVFGNLDFVAMKEGQPDELFAAWLKLPGSQRNTMDAEFRDTCPAILERRCLEDRGQPNLSGSNDSVRLRASGALE